MSDGGRGPPNLGLVGEIDVVPLRYDDVERILGLCHCVRVGCSRAVERVHHFAVEVRVDTDVPVTVESILDQRRRRPSLFGQPLDPHARTEDAAHESSYREASCFRLSVPGSSDVPLGVGVVLVEPLPRLVGRDTGALAPRANAGIVSSHVFNPDRAECIPSDSALTPGREG